MKFEAPKTVTPKVKRWKLAKGQRADLTSPFGIIKVTNADLEKESVLKTISEVEKQTGHKLFGVVFIEA